MDTSDPQGRTMTAAVVSLLAGITFYTFVGPLRRRRDDVVRARIRFLFESRELPYRRSRISPIKLIEAVAIPFPIDRAPIAEKISRAGLPFTADFAIGLSLVLAAIGTLFGIQLSGLAPIACPALAWVGYRTPRAFISARSRARGAEIAEELPDLIDLLVVCTQAGLNVPLSLRRVADRAGRALGEEIRRSLNRVDLGVPRNQALQEMASRLGVPDVELLVRIIRNSDRFGTKVALSLHDFSSEVRARMRRQAEERARKAPVKLLFPLVFLILPGFILLTVVPLVAGTFRSLGF